MKKIYCITCPIGCQLNVMGSGSSIVVEGNRCPKGLAFAQTEMTDPTRILTTTVRTKFPDVPVLSVRTDGEIPKDLLMDAMHELSEVVVKEELGCGDTVLEDVANTGVRVIVTSSALMQLGAELEDKNVQLSSSGTSGGVVAAEGTGVGAAKGSGLAGKAGVLDDIGAEAVGGFVGTAGQAVGVEDGQVDEQVDDESDEAEGEGYTKPKGRPHIKRK